MPKVKIIKGNIRGGGWVVLESSDLLICKEREFVKDNNGIGLEKTIFESYSITKYSRFLIKLILKIENIFIRNKKI